jgi:hypothetical protein
MNPFIIGQSTIPEDSILKNILVEVPGGPIHESDPNIELLYATKDGVMSVTSEKSHFHLPCINILDGFELKTVEDAFVRLLSHAAQGDLTRYPSEEDARQALDSLQRDVGFSLALSQDTIPSIPEGFKLALCLPELLGYVCINGTPGLPASQWGAYLYDFKRTIALFKA